ncbi:hypothetical protein JG688_00003358 [Phytophthora aleatoria]|uniref:GAF domain-containing protein n=1 Tax=Phytophthora aleatoria TaxID=2496075 RepID=A0A8J5IUE7_9STRA|nr:hypothetical protein JG688_00003358 [Phytophthora aleatoria]
MGLTKMHNRLKERRGHDYAGSTHVKSNRNDFSPAPTQGSDEFDAEGNMSKLDKTLSDDELLKRAREAHTSVDFGSLGENPEATRDWKRVKAADGFAVFRRRASMSNNGKQKDALEVMCVGCVDASVEEIASILRSSSEAEHNTVMSGLYAKSFIFGSYEREVACTENQDKDDDDVDDDEQLAVKTNCFSRTTILGHNEQWCYVDYFQRKKERDGFTICKRALPPSEGTPGRITGDHSRVDQLHGLNASYLVSRIPNQKEVRVVFHASFEMSEEDVQEYYSRKRKGSRRKSYETTRSQASASSNQHSKSFDHGDSSKHKTQLRRLLAMAHGVTKLPTMVRRRRFGVQLSLAMAASAITHLSLGSLKLNTKRCYLCGYLVCVDCWSAESMECSAGRVAAIVVCTRCRANVQACEYSEVFASTSAQREKHRGPPRVVEDSANAPTVSLLVDFLSASLLNSDAGSSEHAAVMAVIRTLLRQDSEDSEDDSDDDCSDEDNSEYDHDEPRVKILGETEAVEKIGKVLSDEEHLLPLEACKFGKSAPLLTEFLSTSLMNTASSEDRAAVLSVVRTLLQQSEQSQESDDSDSFDEGFDELHNDNVSVVELGKYLSDDNQLPELETCVFANSKKRGYPIAQPDDPVTMVPPTIIPPHEQVRLRLVNNKGLMLLAKELAPVDPAPDAFENVTDVRDLDILMFEEANKRRHGGWSGSQYSESSGSNLFGPTPSFSTQHSDEYDTEAVNRPPSDSEMLERARASHMNVDFEALSAGPEQGGPWNRVEAADRFVVFRRPSAAVANGSRLPGLDVMCAGRLDASLEEVASVLHSNCEVDLASSMQGLHAKSFVFGSLDRDVPCSDEQQQEDESYANTSEQLNVKTSSFTRTNLFSRNEQWCFTDFFQRKKERDGFTISQRALPPSEPTPGRVVEKNARVDQLHGLNASYLVDQLPDRKGLRVVYNAWFEDATKAIEGSITSSDRKVYDPDNNAKHRGPVKVVEDKPDDCAASLLTEFLAASLVNDSADGADRAAVLSVIRMLLRQSEATDTESDELYDDSDDEDLNNENISVDKLAKFLSDEDQLPELEACVLASAERREYLIDLPDDPATMVPSSVIPSHDDVRIKVANDKGLLLLAYQLAPLHSIPDSFDNVCDVRDLDLLCQLAVRATGCTDSFVTVMGVKHNHVVAATNPGFYHAAVPREQTICQHTVLTTRPFLATHPEADVRFHEIVAVKALSIRFYVGFPVTVFKLDASGKETEIPVGTLCCIDSTARAELTRSQYATMKRLTDTASRLIQLKGRQLQDQLGPETALQSP